MQLIINKVDKKFQPKDGFSCAGCPLAKWRAGRVEPIFSDLTSNSNSYLDCYCTQTHMFTFDSTKKENDFGKNQSVAYNHFTDCQWKMDAMNALAD